MKEEVIFSVRSAIVEKGNAFEDREVKVVRNFKHNRGSTRLHANRFIVKIKERFHKPGEVSTSVCIHPLEKIREGV